MIETLTRLATELESLSVQYIGTRSIQHPDLYRIACELRELAANATISGQTQEQSQESAQCDK